MRLTTHPLARACALVLLIGGVADARTLQVGEGKAYAQPSAAIAAAEAGDTVEIAPGEYFDCAIVGVDRLTIAGLGEGATLTDRTCQGKALLVIAGRDVTVRNLTLARARVPDRNGAGIRAEGDNLTVDHVRFVNNEEGILTIDAPNSTIRVLDSEFRGNGRCVPTCAHAIYAGRIALLRVERSRFVDTREGHHIKSRAARTELFDNDIADGPEGTASYFVDIAEGGDLLMWGNQLRKGPKAATPKVVMLGAEGRGEAGATQIVRANTLTDESGTVAALVTNWGAAEPVVSRNVLPAGVAPLSTSGALVHRIRLNLYDAKSFVGSLVDLARRGARKMVAMAR